MYIGNVKLQNQLLLAPMAGVTDVVFRRLCVRYGAALTYTEMISARGLCYGNKNTRRLLRGETRPAAVQLFGNDPDIIAREASSPLLSAFDIIDLNMGCPAKKITGSGQGSALLRDAGRVKAIISQTAQAAGRPVTVKLRAGWDDTDKNAPALCELAQLAGAAAVTVHGRTAKQGYSGRADYALIRQCVQAVSIPVIGNGDVTDGPSALQMLEQTGCAAVMVGRGAQGAPFVFRSILSYLETGHAEKTPPKEILAVAKEHAALLAAEVGEAQACRIMRKHLAWYTKGLRGAAEFRARMSAVERLEEINGCLSALLTAQDNLNQSTGQKPNE